MTWRQMGMRSIVRRSARSKTGQIGPIRVHRPDAQATEYLRLTGRESQVNSCSPAAMMSRGLTTRQYADLFRRGGQHRTRSGKFGTHSLHRTKAVLIYRRTGNLRAVQLLLGHSKIESTVRYLGIEVDDAIEIAEKIDI